MPSGRKWTVTWYKTGKMSDDADVESAGLLSQRSRNTVLDHKLSETERASRVSLSRLIYDVIIIAIQPTSRYWHARPNYHRVWLTAYNTRYTELVEQHLILKYVYTRMRINSGHVTVLFRFIVMLCVFWQYNSRIIRFYAIFVCRLKSRWTGNACCSHTTVVAIWPSWPRLCHAFHTN